MADENKVSKSTVWVARIALLVAAIAFVGVILLRVGGLSIGEGGKVILPPEPTPLPGAVIIKETDSNCESEPHDFVGYSAQAVCFYNDSDSQKSVTLKFDKQVWDGQSLIDTLEVPYGQKRCVYKNPDAPTSKMEIPYAIVMDQNECSDPSNRPKIIFDP